VGLLDVDQALQALLHEDHGTWEVHTLVAGFGLVRQDSLDGCADPGQADPGVGIEALGGLRGALKDLGRPLREFDHRAIVQHPFRGERSRVPQILMSAEQPDLSHISPEDFAQLVAGASDEQIAEVARSVGASATLDRVFDGMRERFLPDRARGENADIQFVVADEGTEHPYLVRIHEGACTIDQSRAQDAKVILSTDLVSFLKLVAGKVGGPQLFMTGKMKVSGDLLFATRIMGFFEPVNA
jgi:putative sterol carrier protein